MVTGGFYPPLRFEWGSCYHSSSRSVAQAFGRMLSAPTGCVQKCSCLNVFIDFCKHLWYNIFILQVPPMHRSERNLDVRVGIMPTIPRYTGETTWKTTSKTTESTTQNNRLFLKTNPLLLLQKQKQELLQRQQRKLSRKKPFLLVRRTSRPEREAFFSWTGCFFSGDGHLYRRLLRYPGYTPSASHSLSSSPRGGAEGAARRIAPFIQPHC